MLVIVAGAQYVHRSGCVLRPYRQNECFAFGAKPGEDMLAESVENYESSRNLQQEDLLLRIEVLQREIAGLKEAAKNLPVHPQPSHGLDARSLRQIVRVHRSRADLFDKDFFSDPAWEILLEAYIATLGGPRISISGLYHASGAPESTAARWIRRLEDDGWLVRLQDLDDGRRSWIQLSEKGYAAMDRYFATLVDAFSSSKVASISSSSRLSARSR